MDELDILRTYYVLLLPRGEESSSNPFKPVLSGISAYLDESVRLCGELQQRQEDALADAVQRHAAKLTAGSAETFGALKAASDVLLAKVRNKEPLPAEDLCNLNSAILAAESRYPYAGAKSDVIPPQLLAADPSAKLYSNLQKKVEVLCSRSLSEVEQREQSAFKAYLLEGGHDQSFDTLCAELAGIRSEKMQQFYEQHSVALSQSDHLPVLEAVHLGEGKEDLRVVAWNIMEFPCTGAASPMLDGVTPYCDQLLRELERKGTQERALLLEAMSSETVIKKHSDVVLQKIRDCLEMQGSEVMMLQEVNSQMQVCIMQLCREMGWSAHFSRGSDDPMKCDAITGIVSKAPFDEEVQFEVMENKKVRYFAAVRQGKSWLVSCHVPLASSKKQTEGFNEEVALRVLEQLSVQFLAPGSGQVLIAGGDWNSNIHEVAKRAGAQLPTGCSGLHLCAPQAETCLGARAAIDGIFCLH